MKSAKFLLLSVFLMTGCESLPNPIPIPDPRPKPKPIKIESLQPVELEEVELPESVVNHKVILAGIEDAHGNDSLDGLGPNFEHGSSGFIWNLF